MHTLPRQSTSKGAPDLFRGDVWYEPLARGTDESRVRVSMVRFAPGARSAWHSHAIGQWLHITDGVGRVQSRGGEVFEVRAGDTIYTPPGEWHWHGAAPDASMSHIAIWEAPTEGLESEWGEHVSDEEYHDIA